MLSRQSLLNFENVVWEPGGSGELEALGKLRIRVGSSKVVE